jgi:integrase
LRVWVSEGHESLAEITKADVLRVLPGAGAKRVLVEAGLRSLFGILKERKLIFSNPMRGLPVTNAEANIPLPLDTEAVRDALNSSDPATALAISLVAFHALRSTQVRELKLVDIVDGRLTIGDRVIPLAGPVRTRLAAWLDHRQRTWPATINPYLFVSRRSAPRLTPVSRPFPWRGQHFKLQTLREDRILEEVRATGGDVRQVCALFGISVEGAMRYVAALGHPALAESEPVGS